MKTFSLCISDYMIFKNKRQLSHCILCSKPIERVENLIYKIWNVISWGLFSCIIFLNSEDNCSQWAYCLWFKLALGHHTAVTTSATSCSGLLLSHYTSPRSVSWELSGKWLHLSLYEQKGQWMLKTNTNYDVPSFVFTVWHYRTKSEQLQSS